MNEAKKAISLGIIFFFLASTFLALMIIPVVKAQVEYTVGVNPGDWAIFDCSFTFSSNDPLYKNFTTLTVDVTLLKIEVENVSDGYIKFIETSYFRNGTIFSSKSVNLDVKTWWFEEVIDIELGKPVHTTRSGRTTPSIVAANLSKEEKIFDYMPISFDATKSIRITDTITREYASTRREVNYLYCLGFYPHDPEEAVSGFEGRYWWDKITGVMVERYLNVTRWNGNYYTTFISHIKIKETNIWFPITNSYYRLKVKEGDWVEYKVKEITEKAIIPTEFKGNFPTNWISLNKSTSIKAKVIGKKVINFGNYSREFAIANITVDDQPVSPFWIFEVIKSVEQLPLDGYTPFMPIEESYWKDFKDMINFFSSKLTQYGFIVTSDIRKCSYNLRVDHLLIGWIESAARYDDQYGVLSEFSLSFALTKEIIQKINPIIGNVTVDGKPLQLEEEKIYKVKIALADTNISCLINSLEFGSVSSNLLEQAIEKGKVGALITIKGNGSRTISRIEILSREMNFLVSTAKDKVKVEVNSNSSDGKVLVININKDIFSIQRIDELQVFLNGRRTQTASSYSDILNPLDEEEPEYFILIGSTITQVVVSIPSFSTYVIEIVKAPAAPYFSYLIMIGVCFSLILYITLKKLRMSKH